VLGRRVAGAKGFACSDALSAVGASGKQWTSRELDLFLKDPAAYAPGTVMPVAVGQAADRAALVAYLASAKGKAAAREARPVAAAALPGNGSWSDDKPGRIHEVHMGDGS
jgi:hypothetical protein